MTLKIPRRCPCLPKHPAPGVCALPVHRRRTLPGLGLSAVSVSGNTLTFTHPEADPPLTNVTGSYEWALDLSTWNEVGGTIVTIGAVQDTPQSGTTMVTATVTGTASKKVFVRVVATQN